MGCDRQVSHDVTVRYTGSHQRVSSEKMTTRFALPFAQRRTSMRPGVPLLSFARDSTPWQVRAPAPVGRPTGRRTPDATPWSWPLHRISPGSRSSPVR